MDIMGMVSIAPSDMSHYFHCPQFLLFKPQNAELSRVQISPVLSIVFSPPPMGCNGSLSDLHAASGRTFHEESPPFTSRNVGRSDLLLHCPGLLSLLVS